MERYNHKKNEWISNKFKKRRIIGNNKQVDKRLGFIKSSLIPKSYKKPRQNKIPDLNKK